MSATISQAPALSKEEAGAAAHALKKKRLRDKVAARKRDLDAAEAKLTEARAEYAKSVAEYGAHEFGFSIGATFQKKAFGSRPTPKGIIQKYDESGRPVLQLYDPKTNRLTKHLTATIDKADEWHVVSETPQA